MLNQLVKVKRFFDFWLLPNSLKADVSNFWESWLSVCILINRDTRLLVQGITGHEGLFHTQQMVSYGTRIVAGVRPGKGGEWVVDGKILVFD